VEFLEVGFPGTPFSKVITSPKFEWNESKELRAKLTLLKHGKRQK